MGSGCTKSNLQVLPDTYGDFLDVKRIEDILWKDIKKKRSDRIKYISATIPKNSRLTVQYYWGDGYFQAVHDNVKFIRICYNEEKFPYLEVREYRKTKRIYRDWSIMVETK